ncbi:MAG: hypothetical protein O3B45_02930 [Bacteroidetes bacterium]|mgnify:CR=1 FL=1|jgi:hypothetical protein|nr:hypothetical protein [Bacteroidota bacterium]
MKNRLQTGLLVVCVLCAHVLWAQSEDEDLERASDGSAELSLGDGLEVSFSDGMYTFGLGGLLQPVVNLSQVESGDLERSFYIQRSYIEFSASDREKGVSFLIRSDFAAERPLLDAYMVAQINNVFTATIGQFQSIANNREMLFFEGDLAMLNRSMVSTAFAQTGREFGVAVKADLSLGKARLVPMLSVTSGDGMNSFGLLSNDVDRGGLKYGGRLDVYPFGRFSEGNEMTGFDLIGESTPKLVLGGASSWNDGASGPVGESHGAFGLYTVDGQDQLPQYLKNYVDAMLKWKRATLLVEYVNAAAYNLQGAYTNPANGESLVSEQISEYLVLGNAYQAQLGVTIDGKWAVNGRFSQSFPEFESNEESVLETVDAVGACLTWFNRGNAMKVQLGGDYLNYFNTPAKNGWSGQVLVQLQF